MINGGTDMNLDELRRRKKELGYTNDDLAEMSGVPLGTVQRIMSGETKNPRRDTWDALERALSVRYFSEGGSADRIKEEAVDYYSAAPEKQQGEYTVDDYYALPDDKKAELIDGVIYDLSASKTYHQFIAGEIKVQLDQCIRKSGKKCMVFESVAVQLDCDDRTMLIPDVALVCDIDKVQERCIYGAPDFVCEVISPSTRKRDMSLKLQKYIDAGVSAYWIVDIKRKTIITYDLTDEDFTPVIFGFEEQPSLKLPDGECRFDFGYAIEVLKTVYGI